jgi:hypothetical protein
MQINPPAKCRSNSVSALAGVCAIAWLAIPAVFGLSGCAVTMAIEQPEKKDLSLFAPGTHRKQLIAEFGMPKTSKLVGFQRIDVFTFIQGYSRAARAGRALAHGAADVATGMLWEVAGTPAEVVMSGEKLSYEVLYDERDRVIRVGQIN